MLDTLEHIETPEGVSLSVRPAGPYVRIIARIIDWLIMGAVLMVTALIFYSLGSFGEGLFLIFAFIMVWLYDVLFEAYGGGATLGKKIMRLHVVHTNGSPVSLGGAVLRNFLRVPDWLPSLYSLGLCLGFGNARFQRLGDMAASTVVAYRQGFTQSAVTHTTQHSGQLRLALSRDEHKAIVQFAERSSSLSHERCRELANLLTPATGLSDDDAISALQAHANWLSGRA